ncbi:MAG: tRNA (adenosine(37)-N6)-threonylcarbamoyltransferase complex dimerization subunit type 1 TsaB, partial [Phenylobacterium sp.]|nr:tRNA (adenosine(37)-N6)-threonylcarbamoyltransferase complex dimerization subunit type 1 TsaB [Phenylobacterium sp.]
DALPPGTAAARLAELAGAGNVTLVGSGASLLAGALPHATVVAADHADPVAVAQIAAVRLPVPPRPLYLRAPDAKLPGGRDLPA